MNLAARLIDVYQKGFDTLTRTRTAGKQTITVKQVHVTGDQNIISDQVTTGGLKGGRAVRKGRYPLNELCGEKNRQGKPCRRSPSPGRTRCNLHGGRSPRGKDHPRYKHGYYSIASKERRRELRELIWSIKAML